MESFFTDCSELIDECTWSVLGSVSEDHSYVEIAEPSSPRRLGVPIPQPVKNGRLLLSYIYVKLY